MLGLVVQIVVMFAASILVAYAIGSYYLIIGGLVATICYVWFLIKKSQRTEVVLAEGPTPFVVNVVYRFVIAIFLGVVWPSLPIIFAYGGLKAADTDQQNL